MSLLAWFVAIALATLLLASDVGALVMTGVVAAVILLVAAGYAIGAWRALLLALAVFAGLLASDVLWQLDWAPYDRADEREPLPATFGIVFYVPIAPLLIAAGVGLRRLTASGPGPTKGRPARLSGR
jgi:hypothetical protein